MTSLVAAWCDFRWRAVPAGATLTGARLGFSVVKGPAGGVASRFLVHRMLKVWGEGRGSGNLGEPAKAGESRGTVVCIRT